MLANKLAQILQSPASSNENARKGPLLDFWQQAFALKGSITPHVIPNVLVVGLITLLDCALAVLFEKYFNVRLALAIAPFEIIGAALGLLLVLRTNAGYDRWWEARKLWGGIVNQSRNLAIAGLCYGPEDPRWKSQFIRLVAVFPHAVRLSLRSQPPSAEVVSLIGKEAADELLRADHMPGLVALWLGRSLWEACDKHGMDRFAFSQAERERSALLDHTGGCERILKTPLALAYSIKIRRFIALFLLTLPFALIHSLNNLWLVPVVTMLIAYPLFSLDQLGIELQNPFSTKNLSHLPLDEISATIERNLMALLDQHC